MWPPFVLCVKGKPVSQNHIHSCFSFIFFFKFRCQQKQYFMQKCWIIEKVSPLLRPQIIDSIMALFRVDFSGRGELAERQQKLAQMLSRLQKISEGQLVNMKAHQKASVSIAWTVFNMGSCFIQSTMWQCLSPTRWQLIPVQGWREREHVKSHSHSHSITVCFNIMMC